MSKHPPRDAVLILPISHVWLFEGAEGGKWVEEVEKRYQPVDYASSSSTPQSGSPAPRTAGDRQTKKAKVQ